MGFIKLLLATRKASIYTELVISGGCFVFICLCALPHFEVKLEAKELSDAQSTDRLLSIHMGTTQSPTIAVTLGCSDRNLFVWVGVWIQSPLILTLSPHWILVGVALIILPPKTLSHQNILALQQLALVIVANTNPRLFPFSLAQSNA